MITDKKQPLNIAESGNCLKPMLPAVYFFVIILKIFTFLLVYVNISCIFTSELKQTTKK